MNAGLAIERIDDQSGIVGERGLSTRSGSGQRLDACIRAEGFPGFFRLGQRKFRSRLRAHALRREQLAHFLKLAWIVGSDHHGSGKFSGHDGSKDDARAYATANFCKPTSFSMPLRASASNAANWSSLKGIFSAVAWISTILPAPVMTKLASVSASESSA